AQKTIQTYPGEEGFFETVLPHEMGHIIFRELVGFSNAAIPMWLDEGVAMYQERDRGLNSKGYLRQAMREGNFMNIFELSVYNLGSSADRKKVEIYYIESLSMVAYLIREFGREKFVLFCQNLRDKQNLQRAVAASYNFPSLKELDTAWREYIKK
ncbi:MAG: peptidase MA family metallohydrolase, partial [Candidatus Omnitrophota bacterium]